MSPHAGPAPAGSRCRRIALLGAPGTGKTTLAHELASGLRERGLNAVAVPEVLRERCEAAGTVPRCEEHLATAEEQERRVDAAAAGADFVIADTTALMVAVRAAAAAEDGPLRRFALERQQRYDATLVTGLDLAGPAQDLHPNTPYSREQADTLLRTLLQRAGVPYQVVYGQGAGRLDAALQALAGAGVVPPVASERAEAGDAGRPWVWVCDKCSDPACEHRLFSRLKSARA